MKHSTRRIFSLLLVACMLLGMLPVFAMTTTAAENTSPIKDYDTANDGDLLYTVNFNGDSVYSPVKSSDTTKPVKITASEDGKTLTFSEKPDGAVAYYGGPIKDLRITGHVYTVSYYMEYGGNINMRASLQLLSDSQPKPGAEKPQNYRIGVVNQNTNNTDKMNIYANGSVAELTNTVDRMVDKEHNNRQYFKVVVDGVNLSARFYALDTSNNYSLLVDIALDYENPNNYVVPGLMIWDKITGTNFVTVGDVEIRKGDRVSAATTEKSAYQTKYDSTANGGTLYEVDFSADNEAGFKWGDVRSNSNITADAISNNGKTITLNYSEKGAAQIYAAYFPDTEAINYGCYTYEFFVNSANRTIFNPLSTIGGYAVGFSYFNTTPANMFSLGAGWLANLVGQSSHNFWRVNCGVEQTIQNPNTSDPSKPNVKIEVDTYANTVTNYILNDKGEFIKTAWINYGGSSLKPCVYPYAYNANTNATYSNVRIVKGLSVSGEAKKLVELKIGDTYPNTAMVEASELGSLGALAGKPFYTAEYRLDDGTLVSSLDELTYVPGYNYVKLNVVYTPVPLTDKSGAEVRGIQTLKKPGETTTSVRFVGIVNSLDFDAVGVNVWIAYRKDGKTYLMKQDAGVMKMTNNAFTAVSSSGFGKETADTLAGKYLYAVTIENVPIGEGVQVDFYISPVTVKGGAITIGTELDPISVVNGVYKENASPIEY